MTTVKTIEQNPFRMLGLLAGATAKEQSRQVRTLLQYLDAGQEPPPDFSFPALGQLHRTIESVEAAASKLNLDADKMSAALFWFYKGNETTDEVAFEALKDGDVNAAKTIWENLIFQTNDDGNTYFREVTRRNFSAFHNWFVLEMALNKTQWAFLANMKFLDSEFADGFKQSVTDATYRTTKKDMQLLFLNQLLPEMENNTAGSAAKMVKHLKGYSFAANDEFLKTIAAKQVEQIEKKIREAKDKRRAKEFLRKVGKDLYAATQDDINMLKEMLGAGDYKYTSISDKVADEILQCGIDHFNRYKDTDTDPSATALELFKLAKTLAVGDYAMQRCQESTEGVQDWINKKPEREKQKKIESDLKFISDKLERFQRLTDTVDNAKDLVDTCKPKLNSIKNALGVSDEFYLQLSSAVVGNAQGMLVNVVNKAQTNFTNGYSYDFNELLSIINSAYDVTTSMQSMDMIYSLRQRFRQNRETLNGLCNQLGVITKSTSQTSNTSKIKSELAGCLSIILYLAGGALGIFLAVNIFRNVEGPIIALIVLVFLGLGLAAGAVLGQNFKEWVDNSNKK